MTIEGERMPLIHTHLVQKVQDRLRRIRERAERASRIEEEWARKADEATPPVEMLRNPRIEERHTGVPPPQPVRPDRRNATPPGPADNIAPRRRDKDAGLDFTT